MKKILLATTAVVGAAMYSHAALAGLEVKTGGYLEFTAGFFDTDFIADENHFDFQTEAEVFVNASGKADNGLEYSAEIQFRNAEGGGNGLTVDEAFLTLAGSWGKVEMGDTDGATDVLSVYAPVVEGYGQIKTDRDGGANYSDYLLGSSVSVHAVDTDDSTKITYFTPNFSGFQAAISYVPQFADEGQSVVTTNGVGGVDYHNVFELAANYSHDFGAWGLKVGGALTSGNGNDGAVAGKEDFTAWNLGAQVSYGGFTAGLAYVDNDEYGLAEGTSGVDQRGWNVGLTYETGPLAVGVSWLTANESIVAGALADDYDAYGVGMSYTVAPGLVVQSDLMFENVDFDGGTDSDGVVFMLGTRMTF